MVVATIATARRAMTKRRGVLAGLDTPALRPTGPVEISSAIGALSLPPTNERRTRLAPSHITVASGAPESEWDICRYAATDSRRVCGAARAPHTPRLELDQAFPHGVQDRLRAVYHLDLLVDVADVISDRLVADLDLVGDLFVGETARQKRQDLDLSRSQVVVVGTSRAAVREHVDDPAGGCAGNHPLARVDS